MKYTSCLTMKHTFKISVDKTLQMLWTYCKAWEILHVKCSYTSLAKQINDFIDNAKDGGEEIFACSNGNGLHTKYYGKDLFAGSSGSYLGKYQYIKYAYASNTHIFIQDHVYVRVYVKITATSVACHSSAT